MQSEWYRRSSLPSRSCLPRSSDGRRYPRTNSGRAKRCHGIAEAHHVVWVLVSEQTSDDTGSDTCSPMVPDARHRCPPPPPPLEEEEDTEMSPRDENFSNRDRQCATRGPSFVFALGRGGIIISHTHKIKLVCKYE
jgi:hypothetical protein